MRCYFQSAFFNFSYGTDGCAGYWDRHPVAAEPPLDAGDINLDQCRWYCNRTSHAQYSKHSQLIGQCSDALALQLSLPNPFNVPLVPPTEYLPYLPVSLTPTSGSTGRETQLTTVTNE